MHYNKAINRIVWRFSEFDNIKVNNNDIEAINKILEYVNRTQNITLSANEPFSKLYAHTLGGLLEKYDAPIDSELPHRELNRILHRPFQNIVEDITSQINFRYKIQLLKNAGCDISSHPTTISKPEKQLALLKLEKLLKQQENHDIFFRNAWGNEEVEAGLKKQINNYLNGV